MHLAKLALVGGLLAVALAACGITAKPIAGTPHIDTTLGSHSRVDDPRPRHTKCLKSKGYSVHIFRASGGRPAIQVGAQPAGPTVIFEASPGLAQGLQIIGQAQAAEVIGSALLYPNQASDGELKQVEACVQLGVTG